MKNLARLFGILAIVGCTLLLAQTTGYTDNFNGENRFNAPAAYSFEQKDSSLVVNIENSFSRPWEGMEYLIGETIDISANPVINLRMKTDTPFLLSFYIFNAYSQNLTRDVRILSSDTYVTYTIDFTENNLGLPAAITTFKFTPNGNTQDALTARMEIDYLKAGDAAQKFTSIGGVINQQVFNHSTDNRFNLEDLANGSELALSGRTGLVSDLDFWQHVEMGYTGVSFSAGNMGRDTIEIIHAGNEEYANNSILVPVEIEPNFPPFFEPFPLQNIIAGDTTAFQLSGIDDGNSTVDQAVEITYNSLDTVALPDSMIFVEDGGKFSIAALAAADSIPVQITLYDGYTENNSSMDTIYFNAYGEINHPPAMNRITDQFGYYNDGEQKFTISGISDGDDGSQMLSFSAVSADQSILPDSNITINHNQGDSQADFVFLPAGTGKCQITVAITDDGGNENNNGDQSITKTFMLEVGNLPVNGHAGRMQDLQNWGIGQKSEQTESIGSFKGRDNVLKIEMNSKSCWSGAMYFTPEMDLENHRYLSYDIYFENMYNVNTNQSVSSGQTHCYFYDDGDDANEDRNIEYAHSQRKTVPSGEWQTVFFDFRADGGMNNNNGEEINVHRIQKVLINYATSFGWPFPMDNGKVYIANLKIGDAVPDSIVPPIPTVCTLAQPANQVYFENTGGHLLELTNIGSGLKNEHAPQISLASSDTSLVPVPEILEFAGDSAIIEINPRQNKTGEAVITVTVSAENAESKSVSFDVTIMKNNATVDIEIIRDTLYQEIHGFGTFEFEGKDNWIDLYTKDLGASAMRVGIISNQIEWRNDNNDPDVLDLSAFDRSAFDFEYYRELKEKGVENFILTSWSPPAWMKRNLAVAYAYASAPKYENTDNVLEPHYYDEFAESLVGAYKMFQQEAGIDLFGIGPQNEPAFCEPYASAVLSPYEYAQLMAEIGERFERETIDTKFYMPEQVFSQQHYPMKQYINTLANDYYAKKYVSVIATHGYDETGTIGANPVWHDWRILYDQTNRNSQKELWMTETFPEYENWNSAFDLAMALHGALVWGNVSWWTLWNIEGTLIQDNKPTASFYTSKNYYKYIRPGARRAEVVTESSDVIGSAYIHPETKQQTVVLINQSSSPVSVNLNGDRHADFYDVYITAKNMNFEFRGISGRSDNVLLPGESVTTLVGTIDESIIADIDDEKIPQGYHLYQNYPNPFNPETRIQFQLPENQRVRINIYNLLGQRVKTLVNQPYSQGLHTVQWHGDNDFGKPVASGIYIYRLRSEKFTKSYKCILLR
ncbi:MAG: T9SS type A sorting domain-containing protein [Fidelibacterota bacterium]